jgi:hypothetical protein
LSVCRCYVLHFERDDMLKIGMVAILLMLAAAPVVHAKDVSAQQAGLNYALQQMEKSEAEYKADAQKVTETEKAIEQKKKQLAEEQKKAELSRKNYLEAREKLAKAQEILDRAWKE